MKFAVFYWLPFSLVILLAPRSAFAYLDPGTGTMILQLLIAGFASVGVAWKLLWRKVCAFGKTGASQSPGSCATQEEQCCGSGACGDRDAALGTKDS